MVTWCDDERDTRASYGPSRTKDEGRIRDCDSHPVISIKDMIKGIHEANNASLYNMGFNEVVYKEMKENIDDSYADEEAPHEVEIEISHEDEKKSEEKNANLLVNNKFADS